MITPLVLNDIKYLVFILAKIYYKWDEPIPEFETRYEGILESCLVQPFQTFDAVELYPTIINKSAILVYLIIKNHPFKNGNKRIGVISLLVFLQLNGHWLETDNEEIYNLALNIAKSDLAQKREVVTEIEEFITTRLTKI